MKIFFCLRDYQKTPAGGKRFAGSQNCSGTDNHPPDDNGSTHERTRPRKTPSVSLNVKAGMEFYQRKEREQGPDGFRENSVLPRSRVFRVKKPRK